LVNYKDYTEMHGQQNTKKKLGQIIIWMKGKCFRMRCTAHNITQTTQAIIEAILWIFLCNDLIQLVQFKIILSAKL